MCYTKEKIGSPHHLTNLHHGVCNGFPLQIITARPEIKFFGSLIYFSGLAKKLFLGSRKVFSFKKFLHRSDLAGLAKEPFRSKNFFRSKWSFCSKWVIFAHFRFIFGHFGSILGSKKFFAFKRFFLVQKVFSFKSGRTRKKTF